MPLNEESPEYRAGRLLGESIVKIFEALAELDGVTTQEAVETWIEAYITERIIDATGDDNATE